MKRILPVMNLMLAFIASVMLANAQTTIFSEDVGNPSGNTAIGSYTGWQNYGAVTYTGTADVRKTTPSVGYTGASGDGNVFFTSQAGRYFEISGINTSGYTNLGLSLGHYKSTTAASNELEVEVSDDGVNYALLSYTRATGAGTANWILITPTGTIPSAVNLRIRFTNTSASIQFRIDDILLTGDLVIGTPLLTSGALSNQFGDVCINSTTAYETFTVEGSDLDGSSVNVNVLAGFSYSLTPNGTYTSTLSLPYSMPTLNSTTIYVKFTPAAVQSYAGTVSVTGGGASASGCSITSASGVDDTPAVTSGNSSNLTYHSATCEGTITDEGCSLVSSYGIEWDTNDNFTPGTGTQVSSNNVNNGDFSAGLTGLPAATTIYYRAYAANSGGTAWGTQSSFTTLALAPPVATAASAVKSTSFQANWNAVTGASGYFLDVYSSLESIATDVAYWQFSSASAQATGGVNANNLVNITAEGGTSGITFVAGADPNPDQSVSASNWDNGDNTKYWQVVINTENYYDLSLSSVQRSSNTGPRDFKVQYKIGTGGTWTDVAGSEVTVANNFTTGTLSNVLLPAACSHQAVLYLRWIMTSNTAVNNSSVGVSGTSRIDNIFITGFEGNFVLHNQSVNALFYNVAGLSSGTTYYYRIRATDGVTSSANSNVISVTTVDCSLITITATANSPLCMGETLNLTSVATGSAGNIISYQWAGPGGFTDLNQNTSVLNPSAGVYTVTVTDDMDCIVDTAVTVTVNPEPTANITGGGALCLGNSGVVILNFTGTPPWSYTVTGSGGPYSGLTSNASENVSVTPSAGGSQSYTVSVSDANCTGTGSGTATFEVSTAPPLTSAKMPVVPVSACSGTITLVTTQLISGQNIEYSWNTGSSSSVVLFSTSNGGPWSPGPFKTTTNQVYVQFGALGTGMSGYNICVQGQNGCGVTNNKCEFVRGTATVPAGITGSSVQCSGAVNQTYSIPVPLPDGVETYVWSFSVPGAVITPINPPLNSQVNIDFPAFTTGILSVQSGLFCLGSSLSAPRNLVISNAPATPAVPTGPVKVCPGQTYTYSVPPIFGATTYNWTIPANATQVGGGTTKTIQVKYNATPINFSGQILSVSTTSICGATSGTRSKTIASLVPATPGIMSGPLTSACNGPFTYSVTPVSGVTYNWTWPIGVTNNTPNGFNSINLQFPNNFTTGQVSVTGTAAGCAITSNTRTVNVKGVPATPEGIIAAFPPCNNDLGQFQINAVTGATSYDWTVPQNGTTIDNGQGTTNVDVIWGSGPGTMIVKALNGCGISGSRTLAYTPGCRLAGDAAVEPNLGSLMVYPNPANTHVRIAFNAAASGSYVITLVDVTGREVAARTVPAQAGINTVDFSLDTYAKGIYLLELRSGNSMEQAKLVIE
ncbi:MAG: T9SS type A sorting domain-containing protein [Bacteroidia bacterium]|nr:T9SS type A sorting domain-containing protein [Bacteroidia bacterium]